MMTSLRRLALCLLLGATIVIARSASAANTAPSPADVQKSRDLFKEGLDLAKKTEWAEALHAFEQSQALRAHGITNYNIGVCQRALGQYTKARAVLAKTLADNASNNELPPSLASEAKGYVTEIEALLVKLDVTVSPADAKILVDGRPLEVEGTTTPPTVIAGLAEPGPALALPAGQVTMLVAPGTHLFTVSRQGFSDVILNKTFAPGAKASLALSAAELPATINVASNLAGAAVSLDGLDVGVAPLELSRPTGKYTLLVRHEGYVPYQAQIRAEPGARMNFRADLAPEKTPIYKRWWFWTGAAVVVASAILITYFATRPSPERPPVDGGGLNWALQLGQ